MQIMCSRSVRVVWCSWIRCLPRRGIRCQRANSFTCNIFFICISYEIAKYLYSICKIFERYLLSIFNSRAQLDQLDLVVRKRGIRCHIDLSTTTAAAPFIKKMSRVFNVFVMRFNVFAYHLYGICKVFLSICRVK